MLIGSAASGLISAISGLGVEIRSVEIDLPLNDVGTTDPSITLSGTITGAYTFHSDTTLNLRFGTEDVFLTTADFSDTYTGIVRYVRYGDQTNAMETKDIGKIPLPSRLKAKTYS